MIADSGTTHPTSAAPGRSSRVRGTVAVRVVGDLIVRLAGGDGWEFAAFRHDDDLLVSGSSGPHGADLTTLRAEIRVQRFAGSALPHVGTSLSSDDRRSLFVLFGHVSDRLAIFRISRSQGRTYGARDGSAIELFFRQHGDAITAAIFDEPDDAEQRAARCRDPMAFLVDSQAALVSVAEEGEAERDVETLRAHLMPHHGEVAPVLRPIVAQLVERYHDGTRGNDLVVVLPFALVRLTPMRARGGLDFLVTVEWLRNRASLEVTATRYAVSKRELQVLVAMLRGAAVAEIAAELSISESTVVFHLKRMLKKTASRNRTELAARMLGWDISASSS